MLQGGGCSMGEVVHEGGDAWGMLHRVVVVHRGDDTLKEWCTEDILLLQWQVNFASEGYEPSTGSMVRLLSIRIITTCGFFNEKGNTG